MNFSQKLLTELKTAQGLPSDYKTALYLQVSKQNISDIKNGKHQFSDETVVKIADRLGQDPIELLAKKHIQCNDSRIMRDTWIEILKRSNIAQSLELSGFQADSVA